MTVTEQQVVSPFASEFARRVKGQRYEKCPVDLFVFEGPVSTTPDNLGSSYVASSSIRVLGIFDGFDGYGSPCQFQALAVTVGSVMWPCYRKFDPSRNYAICHAMQWRSHKVGE